MTQPAPATLSDAIPCRACDSPLAFDQAYCLRCGEPAAGRAPALPRAAPSPSPGHRRRRRPGRAAAQARPRRRGAGGLALLVGGVLLGSAIAGDELRPASIRVQVPAAKAPVVNVAAPAAAGVAPIADEAFVSDWPDKAGWTVQLRRIPKEGATIASVKAAKSAATARGAPAVGALDSDEHLPLPGGSYIVFSKRYKTKALAAKAASGLRERFPEAKAVRVPAPGGGDTRARTSDSALEDVEKSSGEDFVKKSKKLPDQVQSEGKTLPKDDKPAGGGSKGETIG